MRKLFSAGSRGTTLVTAVLAMMALLFAAISGLAFYGALANSTVRIENRIIALDLAISQLGDLSVREYADADLSVGNHAATATIAADVPSGFGITYTISTASGPADSYTACTYKTIVVTSTYPGAQQVQLTGYMILW
jgi:hypothetical protein